VRGPQRPRAAALHRGVAFLRRAGLAQLPRGRAGDLSGFELRRAGSGDLAAVTALWIELTRHHAALDPHFALRPGAEVEARHLLDAQLRDPDTAILVAGAPDRLDAFAIVLVRRAPPIHPETCRAEITDLYVAPARRRCGCGQALVAAATSWARGRGAERIEVHVSPKNPEAQAFWRAVGYGAHMNVLHRRL
jgi:GNAT superfamily N-acetyltransferase